MKNKLLLALLLACGSPTESDDIGSVSQPIYMPSGYGIESAGGAMRCDTLWDGGTCYVPDNNSAKIFVDESTCPEWYVIRISNAIIDMNNFVAPLGWSIQRTSKGSASYTVACTTDTAAPAAYSWHSDDQDCHSTSRGLLCQTRSGNIRVQPGYIESKPIFQNATSTQQRFYVANIVRHEIGHVALGFGHLPGTQQGKKLMAKGFPDSLASDAWSTLLLPDDDERRMLDCYTAGSSTEDSCE